jgi:hypothetical protein
LGLGEAREGTAAAVHAYYPLINTPYPPREGTAAARGGAAKVAARAPPAKACWGGGACGERRVPQRCDGS